MTIIEQEQLIEKLTGHYNKLRRGLITSEELEVNVRDICAPLNRDELIDIIQGFLYHATKK